MKRFSYYLAWTILIGLFLYFGMKYRFHLEQVGREEFDMMPLNIFIALFPVVVGMLLRLPKFIIEVKERKQWIFDWVKYTVIGLPALYIVVMSIIPYSSFGQGKVKIPGIIFVGGPTITIIAGIILGYTALDGLKKK